MRSHAETRLVSYDLTLDIFGTDFPSCEGGDDDGLGDTTNRGGGGTTDAGEVVAIGSGYALDETDVSQPAKLAREAMRGELVEQREQVGTADAGDVDPRVLQGMQQGVIGPVEEVDALDGLVIDRAGLGKAVEGPDTGGEVIERGEMRQVAAVAGEQDLAQVDQAVDGLLDGGQRPRGRSLPMFHLAVVLEEGHVVGRGLDAQHAAELVVHLDRST